jgi:GMP synthase (glutamine-hydrolysing)
VLHWHGDSFDLPSGASRLASNQNYENQAFAYGHNALALQFHLEAEPRQLEEWYVGHAVELAAAGVSVLDLRAQTLKHRNGLALRAERVFSHWLRQLSPVNTMSQPNVRV